MKFKIVLIFALLSFSLTMGIIIQSIQRDKKKDEIFLKNITRMDVHYLNGLMIDKIKNLNDELIKITKTNETVSKTEAEKKLTLFQTVGAININTNEIIWQVGKGTPQDIEFWVGKSKEIPIHDTTPRLFSKKVSGDNLEIDSEIGYYIIASITDKNNTKKDPIRLFGVLKSNEFQNIISNSEVLNAQFIIFNQRGQIINHSTVDYIGNSLVGDKLFEDIRKTRFPIGEFSYKDIKGDPVFTIYETVEATDLTIAAQVRPGGWKSIDWVYYLQNIFAVLSVIGFASILISFLITKYQFETQTNLKVLTENSISKNSISKNSINENTDTIELNESEDDFKVPPIPHHIIEKLNSLANEERKPQLAIEQSIPQLPQNPRQQPLAFMDTLHTPSTVNPEKLTTLAKIISQLKAPLLSILGHIQIAKGQSMGSSSLNAIEQEARGAREQLDRLGQYCGLSNTPSVTLKISEVLDSSIRNIEAQVVRGSIRVQKNITEDFAVKCDPEDLKLALIAILKNAAESMEHVLKKELIIETSRRDGVFFKIEIKDTGEGILSANLNQLFEPFYSTKSPLDYKGLGLASAKGIIKRHLGEINISSTPATGTTVTISLPISNEKVQTLSDIQLQQRPAWLDLVKVPVTTSTQLNFENMNKKITPLEAKPSPQIEKIDFSIDDLSFNDDDFEFNSQTELKSEPQTRFIPDKNLESKIETIQITSSKKRLKKNDEPLDMIKVQIPSPEEKSDWT